MKNIFFLIMLWSCLITAQVKIQKVDNWVCPGDSLHIEFTYNYTEGICNFTAILPNLGMIWSRPYSSFTSLKKRLEGDTVYTAVFYIDHSFGICTMTVGIDWSHTKETYLYCLPTTGLEENSKNESQFEFYDLYGNRVEKQFNTVLIRARGNKKEKVIYFDN